MITPLDLNNVQLRSGRVLERKKPSVVIQETKKNFQKDNNNSEEEISLPQKENIEIEKSLTHSNNTPIIEQLLVSISIPPFLERLKIGKGVEKQIILPDYDMLDELKNVCIKIPLLQSIKEYCFLQK